MIRNKLAVLFAAIIGTTLAACDSTPENTETPAPLRLVRILEISSPAQEQWREFPGVVDAAQKADLGFRVPGKLQKLMVNEGDSVSKDQLLAQLDDTDYRIQLKSRQAEYEQANADYQRALKLVDSGVISRSDFNKLQAQNATAEANLAAARQNLEYTELRAPFAGRIARRHVDNFEELSAMQVVYTLQDTSSLTVKVDVPESIMIQTRQGAEPEVSAFFDTIPDRSFPLNIREVSTQANAGSNTYKVTLSMDAVDGYNILPGMSVTVRGRRNLGDQDKATQYFVPAQAVLEDVQGRYVYLAIPAADGLATVQRRGVETGRLSQQGLEILNGLSTGDRVIIAGMSKMYPDLQVRLDTEHRP